MPMTRPCGIFDLFHPVVALLYCGVILVFSMAIMHPVYLVLTFVAQLALSFVTGGRRAARGLLWQAPVVLVLGIANPFFVSVGSTELFRVGTHAFYLEALTFGLCQGLMLVNVLLSFGNAARIVSSDKVLTVLGNLAPYLSLVISMTMRLVPKFAARFRYLQSISDSCTCASSHDAVGEMHSSTTSGTSCKVHAMAADDAGIESDRAHEVEAMGETQVAAAPKALSGMHGDHRARAAFPASAYARFAGSDGKVARAARAARGRLRLTTVLLGWGLEDSLESADAMRARGWGAAVRRTSYQRYRFRGSDALALAVVALLSLSAGFAAAAALSSFSFYPGIAGIASWYSYLPYAALLSLPLIVHGKEHLRWRN